MNGTLLNFASALKTAKANYEPAGTPDGLPDFSCHSDTSMRGAAHKWHTAQQ